MKTKLISDARMTRIIQGVAILMMILHHMPATNFSPTPPANHFIFSNLKLCVPIYTFLIGFGYAFTREKTLRTSMHRIARFLAKWWALLFLVFIPAAIFTGTYEFSLRSMALNAFGFREDLNWFSWFVYVYLYAMLVFPLFSRVIDRRPLWGTLGLIALTYAIEVGCNLLWKRTGSEIIQGVMFMMIYSPTLIAGYAFGRFRIFEKILDKTGGLWPWWACMLLLAAALIARAYIGGIMGFTFDLFYGTAWVFGLMMIFSRLQSSDAGSRVAGWFYKIGEVSLYMWFLHALFVTDNVKAVAAWMVDWTSNGWIIFLIMAGGSFLAGQLCSAIEHAKFTQKAF